MANWIKAIYFVVILAWVIYVLSDDAVKYKSFPRRFGLSVALTVIIGLAGFALWHAAVPTSIKLLSEDSEVAESHSLASLKTGSHLDGNRSSLKGFTNIQKCVNSVRRNKRLNPNLRIAGIVVNMFDGRTSLSRGVVNELPSIARAANTKMFHTIIRKCEAVNKAQSANVSIFDYDPNCNAVADFTDFVNEYLEGEDY